MYDRQGCPSASCSKSVQSSKPSRRIFGNPITRDGPPTPARQPRSIPPKKAVFTLSAKSPGIAANSFGVHRHLMAYSNTQDFTHLSKRALARARRFRRDPNEAEDLAQEALLAVWKQIQAGKEIEALEPYLMITLRHLAYRKRSETEPLEETLPDTAATAETTLTCVAVWQAIKDLPHHERKILRASLLLGLGHAQLAKKYDLPVGTVASRIGRARARLREQFDVTDQSIDSLLS